MAELTPARLAELRARYSSAPTVIKLLDEIERLPAVIRETHVIYCNEGYTDRGMHAPECRLYEIEP